MDEASEVYGGEDCCYGGVHPNLVESKIIAKEWLKVFRNQKEFFDGN